MIMGWSERSTYHKTMVNRVNGHLRRICTSAEKEICLVYGRITDAWGYDAKTRTYYVCEIKVNFKDLKKAVYQIYDTAKRYKPKYDKYANIIPVIAFPKVLHKELNDYDNWASLSDACIKLGVAIWIIEQSTVRQIQGPKPKSPKSKPKTKSKTTTKSKLIVKAKTSAKSKPSPKSKTSVKSKPIVKAKTSIKPKPTAKTKTTIKSRRTTKSKTAIKSKPK